MVLHWRHISSRDVKVLLMVVAVAVIGIIVALIIAIIMQYRSTIGKILLGIFGACFTFLYNRAMGLLCSYV